MRHGRDSPVYTPHGKTVTGDTARDKQEVSPDLSYSVGCGLMGSETDLFSGSGLRTASLSSSSSDSRSPWASSLRSSWLCLSSSRLCRTSSRLWLFLDPLAVTALPRFPAVTTILQLGVSVLLLFVHSLHRLFFFLPMESSKVMGLVPTDGSIMVTSNKDAKSRKSSLSPRKPYAKQNKHLFTPVAAACCGVPLSSDLSP